MDPISALLGLFSTGSGLFNSYENQKYQDTLRNYAQNPTALNDYVANFVKPLTAGTVEGVNNQSQAYAAERGLSTSPSASQQIQNQAIAPIINQQQQTAFQNAMQALGLGGGATQNPGGAAGQLGSGLSSLLKLFQQNKGGAQPFIDSANASYANNPVQTTDTPSSGEIPPIDLTNFSFGTGA